MPQSPRAPFNGPDPGRSRDEVRQQFLAACEASIPGGPPPSFEAFLAGLDEPERSEVRSELESLGRSYQTGRGASDATVDPPAAPASAGTVDYGAEGTTDQTSPIGTLDYAPGAAAATGEYSGTSPGGGTVDYAPRKQPGAAAADAEAPADGPQMVAGYEILGVLGRGAMGVVYKARQRGLKRFVALKMILSGEHAGEHELGRFRQEAEAVAHLQHPNIVQIYEVGEEQGRPFFSLEFVDGSSLDKKVRGTPLPPREAALLVQKLAEAMDYAHRHGIIHRDLKPANVLLAQDGTPKIGDFGLAKRVEDAGQTATGAVLGTPSYMAPEQAEGKTQEVGPLSDQYSLGAILYELLTGRAPFRGATILDTLQQVRTREPVPPIEFQPGVPRDLETICLKCLQKEAAKRYASAGELAEDLRRFLAGEPILARPVGRAERLWRWCKRNPRTAALSGAIALLVVFWAGSASALWMVAQANEREARRQEGIAKDNEKEATEQKVIATQKKEEAETNAKIAHQNETRAKETAGLTLGQMLDLGGKLHERLQSKRLSLQGSPEVQKLRTELLNDLRQSTVALGGKISKAGTTTFGEEATLSALGDFLFQHGMVEQARPLYQQAYEQAKKHADAEPDNDQARANLAVILKHQGDLILEADGDARAARQLHTEARKLDQDILDHPRDGKVPPAVLKRNLAYDDVSLALSLLSLGDPAAARPQFEEAVKYRQEWSAAEPESWEASDWLMEAQMRLGLVCGELGDDKAARAHCDEAVRVGKDLVRRYDWRPGFKSDLAEALGYYGDALLRLGKTDEAAAKYQESLESIEKAVTLAPDDMSLQPVLALAHERMAGVSVLLNKRPDAAKHYEEALKLRKELLKVDMGNQARMAAYLLAEARAGQHADAAKQGPNVQPGFAKSTQLLLQMARCYAACAAADPEHRGEHVKRALEALRAATKEKDYKDAVVLTTDPDLQALRGEEDFRKVIEEVKAR